MTKRDVPQEAYDLYDAYCHGHMDRRAFFERLGGIAAGGLSVAALSAALLPDYARAQQVRPDDPGIETETFPYASPDGAGEMAGLLAMPKGTEKAPAVLVVHENRGLNPYVEDVARRLAKAGYVALAPDALHPLGGYPGTDDEGREMQATRDREEMIADFQAGAEAVRAHPRSTGKLGVVGFCFGGSVSNELAVRMNDLDAAAPYYGGWPDAGDAEAVSCPLMIHLAGLDARVNGGWPPYEAALMEAGKTYAVHHYAGVNHGFHNDSTSRYDEAAADLSWDRTLAFFAHHLREA